MTTTPPDSSDGRPNPTDTVGEDTNDTKGTDQEAPSANDTDGISGANGDTAPEEHPKGHEDDGNEVVMEDKEDTVIY